MAGSLIAPVSAPQLLDLLKGIMGMDRLVPRSSQLTDTQAIQIFHGPVEANAIPDEFHLEARREEGQHLYSLFALRRDKKTRALIGRPPMSATFKFGANLDYLDLRVGQGRWFLRTLLRAGEPKPAEIEVFRQRPVFGFDGELHTRMNGFKAYRDPDHSSYRCQDVEMGLEAQSWNVRYVGSFEGRGDFFKLTWYGRFSLSLYLNPVLEAGFGALQGGLTSLEEGLRVFMDLADRQSLLAWEAIDDHRVEDPEEREARVRYLIPPNQMKDFQRQREFDGTLEL